MGSPRLKPELPVLSRSWIGGRSCGWKPSVACIISRASEISLSSLRCPAGLKARSGSHMDRDACGVYCMPEPVAAVLDEYMPLEDLDLAARVAARWCRLKMGLKAGTLAQEMATVTSIIDHRLTGMPSRKGSSDSVKMRIE